MQAMQAHRATADVALLQLEIPLKGKSTVPCRRAAAFRFSVGSRFTIAGIGVTIRGEGNSGGTIARRRRSSRQASPARCRSGWSIR